MGGAITTDPLYEFNLANKFGPYRGGPAFEFDLGRAHDEAIYMDSMMCFCVNSECPACTAPME